MLIFRGFWFVIFLNEMVKFLGGVLKFGRVGGEWRVGN